MAKQHGEFESVRAAILETATRLFTEKGIHETSLADIAKEARLSKGTLYYYYPSKEHLVNDISDYNLGRITDLLFNWIDTLNRDREAKEAIVMLIEMLTADESVTKLHLMLCADAMMGNSSLKKKMATKYREWTVMLEVGSLKMSAPMSERLRRMSQSLLALFDGFCLQMNIGVEGINKDALVELILE